METQKKKLSVYIFELHVTVNNIKILSVTQKLFNGILTSSCKVPDIFVLF